VEGSLPSNCANMVVVETVQRGIGPTLNENKAMEGLTRNLDGAPAHRDPRMAMPKSVDDKLSAHAGEAAAAPAALVADLRGSLPYKREPMRVYLGRVVRAARDSSGAR